jgi:hypothetical protein
MSLHSKSQENKCFLKEKLAVTDRQVDSDGWKALNRGVVPKSIERSGRIG